MNKITKNNIQLIYNDYIKEYNLNNCEEKGLKQFKLTNKVSAGTFAFLTLYINKDKSFHDEAMTRLFEEFSELPTGSKKTIQMRHFRTQSGYDIINHGQGLMQLISIDAYDGFRPTRRDESALTDDVWNRLKNEFDHRCATCSSKEGERGFKRKAGITKLEKGHMDPNQPLSYANCIPQCDYCNGIYGDRFVFDQDGNIKQQINFR